jgi:phage protein D
MIKRLIPTTALALGGVLSVSLGADAGYLRASVGGTVVPLLRVMSIVVDADTRSVDQATVVVVPGPTWALAVGQSFNIAAVGGGSEGDVFKGEIVGLEASADARVTIRAFNLLHRLTRGRHSRTFQEKSDAEVAALIAQEAGLGFGPTGPEAAVRFDRIVQHDETDLEFLRGRAARIGYEVFVEDTRLFFQRRLDPSPILLGCGPTRPALAALKAFHPRTISANAVSKVIVRGWDPAKQEEITARATRRLIPLSLSGAQVIDPPGLLLDLGSVAALEGASASYGAALGTLQALIADDVSAEGDAEGNPSLRVGATVSLPAADDRFNGKYLVVGVSHRYQRDSQNGGGYHTLFKVRRNDAGAFILPEVGDEVLVAFEHGDLSRPVVVGSLWDGPSTVEERPPCGPAPSGR